MFHSNDVWGLIRIHTKTAARVQHLFNMLGTQITETERNLLSVEGFIFAFRGLFSETKHREPVGAWKHRKANFYFLFCSANKTN